MITKRSTLTLIILYATITCMSQNSKFNFEYHEIGKSLKFMGQTGLVDVDNDQDLDWVAGRHGDMYWFEYISPSQWIEHEIGKGANTDVGGCPLDVNKDGWIDFVVGDSWYENTGNPLTEKFICHHKNLISCHDNVAVDIDGDGIKDIVSLSDNPDNPVLAWYKIPEDYNNNWDFHKIGKGIHGGIAPLGFGDLDNDNDADVVRGNAWFENSSSDGLEWEKHEVLIPVGGNRPDKYGLALRTWCIDIDKDNDLDIIQAEADTKDGRIFWFENQNNADTFLFHPISSNNTNQDFHSLAVADVDNDGDMDVISGGGPLTKDTHKLFIWENVSGKGEVWKEHLILSGKRIHELVAADVDNDGDIDICSKPWPEGIHFFLENKLK